MLSKFSHLRLAVGFTWRKIKVKQTVLYTWGADSHVHEHSWILSNSLKHRHGCQFFVQAAQFTPTSLHNQSTCGYNYMEKVDSVNLLPTSNKTHWVTRWCTSPSANILPFVMTFQRKGPNSKILVGQDKDYDLSLMVEFTLISFVQLS